MERREISRLIILFVAQQHSPRSLTIGAAGAAIGESRDSEGRRASANTPPSWAGWRWWGYQVFDHFSSRDYLLADTLFTLRHRLTASTLRDESATSWGTFCTCTHSRRSTARATRGGTGLFAGATPRRLLKLRLRLRLVRRPPTSWPTTERVKAGENARDFAAARRLCCRRRRRRRRRGRRRR